VSTATRDMQLALIEGMERPVGPLPLSVQTGTNADLMATVAPMYLTGSVLDVTYGKGSWWDRFTPDPFTFHDLHTVDGVDFRDLPHSPDSFDTVCFDPPYTISGGKGSSTAGDFLDRFGIGDLGGTAFYDLILGGLAEVCRVAESLVLVKCMEFAQGDGMDGTGFHDMPTLIATAARATGWAVHDRIVHNTGTGPGGHNITTIKRARRAHSYLLVFVPANIRGGAGDREASGRSDSAGVTTSTPSADGPHGTSSASGGEPAAHAARPVGSHSPSEDRVVDLMTALEESVAAAKAARQSTNRTAPRSR